MTKRHLLYFMLTFYALFVVMLGAYTRLTDSGLGCPDWPGCYGQLTVAHTKHKILSANELYPATPIEQAKAWPEMVHRYFAGCLGLMIIAVSIYRLNRMRLQIEDISIIPALLLCLVFVQALLGKWTVSWVLHPLAVMPHLLGGITITSLLFIQLLGESKQKRLNAFPKKLSNLTWACTALVVLQIIMGGWTSSHYAALSCPDFPLCQGSLWPDMDFKEAFNFHLAELKTYEGGSLSIAARTAIQMTHRTLALLIVISIANLLWGMKQHANDFASRHSRHIILILSAQIGLGIANILLQLPIYVATVHNGLACILLLAMSRLLYDIKHASTPALP